MISAKDVQPKKADSPISVRVGGSVTCVRPSQSLKASMASLVISFWDRDRERPHPAFGVRRQVALVRGVVPGPAQVEQQVLQVRLVRRQQREQLPERRGRRRSPHLLRPGLQLVSRCGGAGLCGGGVSALLLRRRRRRRRRRCDRFVGSFHVGHPPTQRDADSPAASNRAVADPTGRRAPNIEHAAERASAGSTCGEHAHESRLMFFGLTHVALSTDRD